jgi:type IV secretory pathway VirB4 component
MATQEKTLSSQEFVPIKDIRDGVITLKDGSLRSVILASSLNFSLKSEDERNAILAQFQEFLNSLDFSIQIFVQSRKLDIRPYLALMQERLKDQTNDLMRIQIQEYIEFVRNFTESTNIMTKSFFIVIPYSPALIGSQKGLLGGLLPSRKKEGTKQKSGAENQFEENRTQLEQRISVVEQGLVRCGIRVIQLGTEEVTEFFYKIFNPGETDKPIKLH